MVSELLTAVETEIRSAAFAEFKIAAMQEIVSSNVGIDVELFLDSVVEEFNIYQLSIVEFFKTVQSDKLVSLQVAIALTQFDIEIIKIGEFSDEFLNFNFGTAQKAVKDLTTEDNFVTISFLIDFLIIVQESDGIADLAELNLLRTEFAGYDWVQFFTATTVTYETMKDLLMTAKSLEDFSLNILQTAVYSIEIFEIDEIIEEIQAQFSAIELMIFDFFSTLELTEEEEISITFALTEWYTIDTSQDLQTALESLESAFGVAWPKITASFAEFEIVTFIFDLMVAIENEVEETISIDIVESFVSSALWKVSQNQIHMFNL